MAHGVFACVFVVGKARHRCGSESAPRLQIGLKPPNLLCNHRGWILPATLVEHDSKFLNFPSNLPQAIIGMLACHAHMPTTQ